MAATLLANIIQPEPMGNWIVEATTLLSNIDASGVMVDDQFLQNWLETDGGLTLKAPKWDSLVRTDAETAITEALPYQLGGTAQVTPSGIPTHLEEAVRVERAKVWSATKLAKYFNNKQADPIQAIVNDLAGFWAFRRQAMFLATWAGVFADNDAAPSGSEHVQGDLTHDVSGGGFVDGETNFTAENFIDALGLMDEQEDDLGIIVTHPLVRRTMAKADLLDVVRDSDARAPRTYQGRPIITNRAMVSSAGVYHTYIFGAGCTGRAIAQPDRPFAISMHEEAGGGAGQEAVWSRVRWCMHPYGHRYVGTPTANTGGPTNAATSGNLAHAGSWQRTAPERQQIKAVRLITREHAA